MNQGKPLRVLLVAYTCSPYRGSEPGAGWHRAVETANHYDTWVICEEHEFRPDIERYLHENGEIPNLQFYYVPRVMLANKLTYRISPLYYLAYNMWHRRAYRAAAALHREVRFDVVHQAHMCGYREPGYLGRLDAKFVWGPVGGTQNYPWRFLPSAGIVGTVKEGARSVLNLLQFRFSHRVVRAVRRADAQLAANSTAKRDFERVHKRICTLLLETGLPALPDCDNEPCATGPLRLLWSGQFGHHKALHLLLEALSRLPADTAYELRILGRGRLEKRWRRLSRRLDVERHCRWLGWLPHEMAVEQYHSADLFIFTSLRDTSGNALLEALSHGVPVVCFDHQGAGDMVTEDCGVKIPVRTPKAAVTELSRVIKKLSEDRELLRRLSLGAVERARFFLWARNIQQTAKVYESITSETADASECSGATTP